MVGKVDGVIAEYWWNNGGTMIGRYRIGEKLWKSGEQKY